MKGKVNYLVLALAVVVADQWSKWLVETHLAGRPPLRVIPGFLNLTYVTNTGVAFGMLPANGNPLMTGLLTLLGLAALGVVAYYFRHTPATDRRLLAAFGLILGGAVGNLIDRVASGAVTDFVDAYFGTYHWHTFNVADSAITVGLGLMALDVFAGRRRRPRAAQGSTEAAPGASLGSAPDAG